MPIYEYLCDQGHTFEVIQKFSDEPLTTCQECGQPVKRVLHSPAIHFKGSGFHNTDYGKGKRAKADSSSDSSSKKSDSATTSTSSDSGSSKESKPKSDSSPKSS